VISRYPTLPAQQTTDPAVRLDVASASKPLVVAQHRRDEVQVSDHKSGGSLVTTAVRIGARKPTGRSFEVFYS
jgi:hypothetical protein